MQASDDGAPTHQAVNPSNANNLRDNDKPAHFCARITARPRAYMISFQSSIVRVVLSADSRGNVLFSLERKAFESTEDWWQPLDAKALTCEYMPDVVQASVAAMQWIVANCDEIFSDEGQHLYYRFKAAI